MSLCNVSSDIPVGGRLVLYRCSRLCFFIVQDVFYRYLPLKCNSFFTSIRLITYLSILVYHDDHSQLTVLLRVDSHIYTLAITSHHIPSHTIPSHHIPPHFTTSITFHHILSHPTTPHPIISHHIPSHPVRPYASHHITSHHIPPHLITSPHSLWELLKSKLTYSLTYHFPSHPIQIRTSHHNLCIIYKWNCARDNSSAVIISKHRSLASDISLLLKNIMFRPAACPDVQAVPTGPPVPTPRLFRLLTTPVCAAFISPRGPRKKPG